MGVESRYVLCCDGPGIGQGVCPDYNEVQLTNHDGELYDRDYPKDWKYEKKFDRATCPKCQKKAEDP